MNEKIMKEYTKLPPKKVIYDYWKESPLMDSLNFQAFDGENKSCMACGSKGSIDRAHIVAKCSGGSFQPSNIHCLCQICHKLSEHLEGVDYWLWIAIKSKLYSYGTDMTIELDCVSSEDETLRPYPYEAEYPQKLIKYSKEYTELSMLEYWGGRQEISYFHLMKITQIIFDINYPLMSHIEEVLEIQEKGIHKSLALLLKGVTDFRELEL